MFRMGEFVAGHQRFDISDDERIGIHQQCALVFAQADGGDLRVGGRVAFVDRNVFFQELKIGCGTDRPSDGSKTQDIVGGQLKSFLEQQQHVGAGRIDVLSYGKSECHGSADILSCGKQYFIGAVWIDGSREHAYHHRYNRSSRRTVHRLARIANGKVRIQIGTGVRYSVTPVECVGDVAGGVQYKYSGNRLDSPSAEQDQNHESRKERNPPLNYASVSVFASAVTLTIESIIFSCAGVRRPERFGRRTLRLSLTKSHSTTGCGSYLQMLV
mmetsp:Transcript_44306/g.86963  ORF Transcript_44306/g.86963 Transcript_44306/m.86963 type:complete len:271 (-) Transcript_44306:98-910(-)